MFLTEFCTQKYTRGIILWVGIFLTVTLGTAYLFFYDKQGCQGLRQDATHAIQTHVEEAFSEWISHSTHFTISLFPLMEVWWQAVVVSEF